MSAAGRNTAFRIAAKPLQIDTWLLLTAYKMLPSPYSTVPLPTPIIYRLVTIHALLTDGRQPDDISCPSFDLTVGQKQGQ